MSRFSVVSENGQPGAMLVNGVAVPMDSFLPAAVERYQTYRLYDKPVECNSIPLSPRTFQLLTLPISTLMREKRA